MDTLIKETLSAFRQRDAINITDGFFQEKDIFNEMLLECIGKNLNGTEKMQYQKCRKTINRGLELGRAKKLEAALEQFKKIELILCKSSVSLQCKLLIAAFYCSGLAYLRLKESKQEEAVSLSLQALAINNYLIQEHGYDILEMHRVQQIVNLTRIQIISGQKEDAFHLLFALLRCFENRPEFPAPYRFNTLNFLKEKYASTLSVPAAIGLNNPFLQLEKIYDTPITRFKNNPDRDDQRANQNRFLLDFSELSFELIERMLDQIIVEFIRFTKRLNLAQVKTILSTQGIRSVDDLRYLKIYKSAYLFLAIKIHAANGEHEVFLKLLKSFCKKAAFQPIWKAVVLDFYGFCESSGRVSADVKDQIYRAVSAN